jgi:Ca2+-binding RTX toxin-like protein
MDPVVNETTGASYATLSAAMAASASGDVLTLQPGAYVEDFPDIVHSLTIRCLDGVASLTRATPLPVEGRAILNVVEAMQVDLTLIGLEIFGAQRPGPDPNGAGVLHERGNGNLTIENCSFHGNQNGILVGSANENSPPGGVNVVIRNSEFFDNGAPPGSAYAAGGKCHNIYINAATTVLIEDNHIHSVFSQGHQIKSRAAVNTIIDNVIEDLPQVPITTYGSSYSIDLPDGGVAVISGNLIEKGPYSSSRYIVHFGGESQRYAENSLLVEGNQFVNKRPDGATLLLDQIDFSAASGIPVVFRDNSFAGPHAYAFAGGISIGAGSDDLIDGGPGADSMEGGLGNDSYLVDNAEDRLREFAGQGDDTVRTTLAAYTLGAEVERLVQLGTADFAGTGNTLANVITGGAGNDTLNGLVGADTMAGGAGDDEYVVDNGGDVVTELDEEGTDTVFTSLAWTLADNVENLVLGGTSGVGGTGNGLANAISGNAANNLLAGLLGDDTLSGGDGRDTLDGGGGADSLAGGTGNDLYVVDDAGDAVSEAPFGGADTVQASLAAYLLPDEVEALAFTGVGGFAGTGNGLGNLIAGGASADSLSGVGGNDTLAGNGGADTLDGGTGADSMSGGLGDDSYVVDSLLDVVTEALGGGTDTVLTALAAYTIAAQVEALAFTGAGGFAGTGNTLANSLAGGDGADTLNGLSGADTMAGGLGDDTYVLDNALDTVVEAAEGGIDTLRVGLTSFTLGATLEHLAYTGASSFRGTGNALANAITGGIGADTLDGGTGADTLTGGAGNDLYVVDDGGDVVVEAGGGVDSLRTTLNAFDLAALTAVEHLTFTGPGGFAGGGNALANRIIGAGANDSLVGAGGNDTLSGAGGADTLDGGSGADSLSGGLGNDVFVVENALDKVLEAANGGTDTVRTTLAALTLAAQVENLVFIGAGSFAGTGNTLANALTGGDGADTLNGATGADTMTGGGGDDTHFVDNALDLVVEAPGGGTDTLRTTLTALTLGAEVENLVYTGASAFRGTGNALANAITGGASADTLDGSAGADTLTGGLGNDVYVVDDAGDIVSDSGGLDTLRTTLAAFDLATTGAIETLVFIGAGGFAGNGNALANRLTGGTAADTLDGGAGADTLTGGAGDDVFRFVGAEAAGDVVSDFQGANLPGGDLLHLTGFGTAAEGATLIRIAGNDFRATSADGLTVVTIRLTGVTALGADDVLFA